ncbi:MAG: hypothetical protein V1750_06645 [Acidobacteriota bacterium]
MMPVYPFWKGCFSTAFAVLIGASSTTAQDPLWEKAVGLASRAKERGLAPGRLEMDAFVKKPNGTVEQKSTAVFTVVTEGEESRTELISATQNGKDVTERLKAEEARAQQRDKEERGRKDKHEVTVELEPGYHPFLPKVQPQVTYQRRGDALLDGRKVVLFSFRHAADDGKSALAGRAWLDPETGVPLQVEVSPIPLPKHVDLMMSTTRFEAAADGLWHPASSHVNGEGGMLWIHRVFESEFRFLEWHTTDETSAPAQDR